MNAPEKTYVSLVNVVAPSAPEADASRATKLGLMASVFGFVLTIGIAYFGQRFRARRRARAAVRAAKAGPPPVADQRKPETKRPARRPAPEDEPEDVDPLAPGFPEKAGPDRARSGAEWLPDRDRDHEL